MKSKARVIREAKQVEAKRFAKIVPSRDFVAVYRLGHPVKKYPAAIGIRRVADHMIALGYKASIEI